MLVSILISNYNKEEYIKRCIDSCVRQDYKNIEIIFVDNLSTDNSIKIIKKYKNIKIVSNKNHSKYPAINQINTLFAGLKFCKGQIISLLDSDDFFKKDKIKKIVKYFKKFPKKNLVCDTPLLYYNKKNIKKFFYKEKKKNSYVWPTIFPTSSVSLRKNFLLECYTRIFPNMFPQLEVDFRILAFAKNVKNDFNFITDNLTYYFQNPSGILSFYKKYSFYWWNKRFEAHKFMELLYDKNRLKFVKTFDYKLSYIMKLISDMYFKINPSKVNSLHLSK
jgi:glycosyltransferase involved in cell wall biosynthesis